MTCIQRWLVLLGVVSIAGVSPAQDIRSVELGTGAGLMIRSYTGTDGKVRTLPRPLPLVSYWLNDTLVSTATCTARKSGDSIVWSTRRMLNGVVRVTALPKRGVQIDITFRNASRDTVSLADVVPFGEDPSRVFIRANGPATPQLRLSRSALFRPGYGPIGVVLPDNAWEMGFCDAPLENGRGLTAIARRQDSASAELRRFRADIPPGGWVAYRMYLDDHPGDWRDGMRMMFRDRWLYDLETFDTSLFQRADLAWIRSSYLLMLQFAWDQDYYDALAGQYRFDAFLTHWNHLVGGFEAFMLWPTWPRLGVDQRNQWDMYKDLPGGLPEIRRQVGVARKAGTRYFIAYNPWDESTRREDHLRGMEDMLRKLDADGVVLDTWGQSSREFQGAADRVKPGVILYSEGMAVPKDMPGIVAGRVHDAIYMPPPLNLNRLIKPDFAIFRVIQVAEGRIHREIAVAFFNGHGTELNIMRPGRPGWIEEELAYLGRTTKILRENSAVFMDQGWTPLVRTAADSIWVNAWQGKDKTLFTVYNLRPEGWSGPLFKARVDTSFHAVDIWNHEELSLDVARDSAMLSVTADGFSRAWLGTRREGSVDCIALFKKNLRIALDGDSLSIRTTAGSRVVVWAGEPAYNTPSAQFTADARTISLYKTLGRHEEKVVVQLFNGTELMDERIVEIPLATPRPIATRITTTPANEVPQGMVRIPAGPFRYASTRSFLSPNEVIPYPGAQEPRTYPMVEFYMDTYPVTNAQFRDFLAATRYAPADGTNFLKHWVNGQPVPGSEKHPVVYVDRNDAAAYARWAGKRLPTELEWQYAAQGTDGRKYPWGKEFDSTRCNYGTQATAPVDAFPTGASPFGVMDMVGNVWQLTADLYANGTFYYGMLRGGSYYNPTSSWWYVRGGPQPVDNPQILLLVAPGFDRCATVGFRCVKDAARN
ncbi:MAG: SUMF1/EgtB/PvdO family nonheme iron enzyme [Ignavibacteriae bacterium]|nr:SUMF1/EgtB/PvdO family nonheme iron enzyme [Ignavibacteriota bacterium]